MNEIFNIIEQDLSGYGQHNLAPESITIGKDKDFRHYELGSCFGLVAFNEGHVFVCEIKEDDDNWFCFNNTDKSYYDAEHLKTKMLIYSRMNTWLEINMKPGYYYGNEGKKGFECGFTNFK